MHGAGIIGVILINIEKLKQLVQPTIEQIDAIIDKAYPIIRAEQAKEVFDAEGAYNGHNKWLENEPSYKKRKNNKPIMQKTGYLYQMMTDPDNYIDDADLPLTIIEKDTGYRDADLIRPFSDIGTTENDIKQIENLLVEAIVNELS